MQRMTAFHRFLVLAIALVLASCGGGGGGGGGGGSFALNGGPVPGSVSLTALAQTYTFNVVADTAYTVTVATSSGDTILQVYQGSATTGTLIGWNWNGSATTPYNTVSFVAGTTGTVSAVVSNASFSGATASYTIQAYSGELTPGTARSGSTYNGRNYWSFEAVAGTAYKVSLTPQSGNVNIGQVYPKMGTSVGSSVLAGTATDTVRFIAPASQRYYIEVSATSVTSTYDIRVDTTSPDPDLSVIVDSAMSDGKDVTITYTVRNNGINSAGAFDVAVWSNSASAPAVGATGEGSATHAALAGGATVRGSVVVPNAGATGTAYAVVDSLKAVTELDETNNVSAGMNWEKPLIAPQTIDFESGTVPTAFVMSGAAGWTIDTTTGSASTKSLKAGAAGNSQKSCTSLSAANAKSIKFDYAVSSELYYDYLKFYIDGVEQWGWYALNNSGTVAWTSSTPITVGSGAHVYTWCYEKSLLNTAGSDTAWIDNIVLTQATVDLMVTVNYAVSNGTSVNVNYTVQNLGNSAVGPFEVDVWSNSAAAPAVGAAGEGKASHTSLGSGSSVTNTVTVPNASAGGAAYAIVDTLNAVTETNETNNVSAGYAWTSAVDLQVTVTSAVSDRSNVVVNYKVTNAGASAAGAFRVDLWSNSASAPVVGAAGESFATHASLGVGATVSGSLTIPNAGASGTAYAIVDSPNAVAEAVETNNVSAGLAWKAPVLAPVTYNFNNSVVPADMVMSGNAAWVPAQIGNGANAMFTLKAGTITHNQTTCVAISAANSSSVSFSYSVSSESGWDFLKFYIDGVWKTEWSGSVAWTTGATFSAGTTGVHEFKWCYTKDGVISSGSDTAWIDDVVIN